MPIVIIPAYEPDEMLISLGLFLTKRRKKKWKKESVSIE